MDSVAQNSDVTWLSQLTKGLMEAEWLEPIWGQNGTQYDPSRVVALGWGGCLENP